jgi:hypothetical protein
MLTPMLLLEKMMETKEIDRDYFMTAPDDMVEYLTAQQEADYAQQNAIYSQLQERAQKLLNLLVVVIGGTLAFVIGLASTNNPNSPAGFGLAFLMAGWIASVIALCLCVLSRKRPTIFSSPELLFHDDEKTGQKITLVNLKRQRISDVQQDINKLMETNREIARYLNGAIFFAVASPLVCMLFFSMRA